MADMIKRKDGSYSKRGLWDNIRANKGSGKKPTAEMLEQENKIKNKNKMGKMKKMYGGTKKKMQAGGVDKTSERFKKALANTKSRNSRLAEEKRLSAVKKSGMDVSYADRAKMQKGGTKPDYLDMDGDGNKTESMKSAVASKKKMQKGGKLSPAGSYPGGTTNAFVDEMSVVKKDSMKTTIKKDMKKKPAAKKAKPAPKKMGGAKKMMYK